MERLCGIWCKVGISVANKVKNALENLIVEERQRLDPGHLALYQVHVNGRGTRLG